MIGFICSRPRLESLWLLLSLPNADVSYDVLESFVLKHPEKQNADVAVKLQRCKRCREYKSENMFFRKPKWCDFEKYFLMSI